MEPRRAHSYDLPMIIYDLPEPPAEPAYWTAAAVQWLDFLFQTRGPGVQKVSDAKACPDPKLVNCNKRPSSRKGVLAMGGEEAVRVADTSPVGQSMACFRGYLRLVSRGETGGKTHRGLRTSFSNELGSQNGNLA